jgi:pimeloyl-ACP methyl ester carboxylesterase
MTYPDTRITEHTLKLGDHEMFYLAAGPEDGPLIVFVHGWPELGYSWRHQLPVLGGLGFRAIAPDLRGHGRSSVYPRHDDYSMEKHVGDLIHMIATLGREKAVWVGHDWGASVVWSLASHHPEHAHAVANLCIPYASMEAGLQQLVELVDRRVYPEADYPAGQWDYQYFYEENFERATTVFDANPETVIKALFRSSFGPDGRGTPAITATIRRDGGWFGGLDAAPDTPLDEEVISEEELRVYANALTRTGFFGTDSFYMNHGANKEYFRTRKNDDYLDMPALFLAASQDYVCECVESRLPEPMRKQCRKLTEKTIDSGHWMAQEKPLAVNNALVRWLANAVPEVWP